MIWILLPAKNHLKPLKISWIGTRRKDLQNNEIKLTGLLEAGTFDKNTKCWSKSADQAASEDVER